MRKLFKLMALITIMMLLKLSSNAQVSVVGNAGVPANYDGWDILQPFPLSMKHEAVQPIDFYTNAGALTFLNQKMQITANANPLLDGFVGIGNSNAAVGTAFQPGGTFPNFKLDVDGGDINIHLIAQGYRIGGSGGSASNFVLRHNGILSNIYVGVLAGNSTSTGINNTFVGSNCGSVNTAGLSNTFVGFNSGALNTGGSRNTFIGNSAGTASVTGDGNTFIGNESGFSMAGNGGENTFVGSLSGHTSNGSGGNTFVGTSAGFFMLNQSGCTFVGNASGLNTLNVGNSFFGTNAGASTTQGRYNSFVGMEGGNGNVLGSFNSTLGYLAGLNNGSGIYNTLLGCTATVQGGATRNNCTAVGANTIVPGSNQLILGGNTFGTTHNDVNVGIGLSGDNIAANGLGYEGPAVKLEINADPASFSYTGGASTNGESGLRFRQLKDISIPNPTNTGLGILTVDVDGDVVYVEDIGNYCSESPQRPLHGDYEIALDNGTTSYDYHFTGQQDGSTDVVVGGGCSNGWPYAKFQSLQFTNQTSSANGESNGGLFYNSTANRFAIGGVGVSDQSEDNNFGLKGFAKLDAGKANYGVFGTTINFPVMLAGGMNVGVYGYSPWSAAHSGATLRFGVIGDLGIVSPCVPPPCPVTAPDYAGYFNGDVASTTGFWVVSDASLKENITDMNDAMSVISQLNPKAYEFKQEQNESMQLPRGTHYGFLSQEIESTLPQLVKESIHPAREDSTGNQTHAAINFKALNYMEIIPFLVGAIKEQQQSMEAMQAELASLSGGGNRNGHTGSVEENGGKDQGISNKINVELNNAKSIILNQNVPNPFAEQTTISYFLTNDVKKAQIFFYDSKGVILKIVDVNEKGAGQLNVYAADLSSGSYTYSLIADGKLIETKKMVKTN